MGLQDGRRVTVCGWRWSKTLSYFLLAAALMCRGLPCVAADEESITGRLVVARKDKTGPLTATLVEPRPGGIFQIANWAQLSQELPPGVKSGATVTVAGRRLPQGRSQDSDPTLFQFDAARVTVVAPAPPVKLRAAYGNSTGGAASPRAVAGQNLDMLVIRPRLPADCAATAAHSIFQPADWLAAVDGLNKLQIACTRGRLTYVAPNVVDVDIPCTPMPNRNQNDCRDGVYMRWVEDALDIVQNQLDPWLYDHIVLDLPDMDDCKFAAWAEMDFKLMVVVSYLDAALLAHEAGHNYNLNHAAVARFKSKELPAEMPDTNEEDDSGLMGYYYLYPCCYTFPEMESLGFMSADAYPPSRLPAGQTVSVTLQPHWGPPPQGAVIYTKAMGRVRLWASYSVTTGGPYADMMQGPVYNQVIIFHLSSSDWLEDGWYPTYFRTKVLQSGTVFRWDAVGLVFKFEGVNADGQQATLLVCHQTATNPCSFQTSPMLPGPQVKLQLPKLDNQSDWCLQACTDQSCQLPAEAAGLTNVFFTSPCPNDDSSKWYTLFYPSGWRRWANVATGLCLAVKPKLTVTYTVGDEESDWEVERYRLVLEACRTAKPPDYRTDKQLFLPQQQAAAGGLSTIIASVFYPGQDYGSDYLLGLEACPAKGGKPCKQYLPKTPGVKHAAAVAGYSWEPSPDWPYPERKLFQVVQP